MTDNWGINKQKMAIVGADVKGHCSEYNVASCLATGLTCLTENIRISNGAVLCLALPAQAGKAVSNQITKGESSVVTLTLAPLSL